MQGASRLGGSAAQGSAVSSEMVMGLMVKIPHYSGVKVAPVSSDLNFNLDARI